MRRSRPDDLGAGRAGRGPLGVGERLRSDPVPVAVDPRGARGRSRSVVDGPRGRGVPIGGPVSGGGDLSHVGRGRGLGGFLRSIIGRGRGRGLCWLLRHVGCGRGPRHLGLWGYPGVAFEGAHVRGVLDPEGVGWGVLRLKKPDKKDPFK